MDKNDLKLIKLIIASGWLCLLLSSTCFYFSTLSAESNSDYAYALWLMTARLFGFGAFVIGGFSIFNQYWFSGVALFIGSVALPFISLYLHGTI